MKKILSILLMLTCVLGLTACGGEVETLKYDANNIKSICDNLYEYVSTDYSQSELDQFHDYNDDDLAEKTAEYFEETGIRVDEAVLIAGIDSWLDSKDVIGKTKPTGVLTYNAKSNELTVRYEFTGEAHDGSIDFIFDKNLHVTSITTNPKYSMEESMQKAGINTAVGMGTVFVMLIVIMIIINILGGICGLANKPKKKAEEKKDSVDKAIEGIVAREETTSGEAASEEVDDLELIAVISAAIAASEGTTEIDGFVVRSIRRIR